MTNPEYLEHAKVVRVQTGDVIWVGVDKRLTREQAETLSNQLKPLWPDNQIVLAQEGTDITVVRGEAITPLPEGPEAIRRFPG